MLLSLLCNFFINLLSYLPTIHLFIRGLPINDIHSQGGGGLPSADIYWSRGRRIFKTKLKITFLLKNFGFFEVYGVSTRIRERGLR